MPRLYHDWDAYICDESSCERGYTFLATQTNILTHIVSFVQCAFLSATDKIVQDRFSTPSKTSVDKKLRSLKNKVNEIF